MISSDWYKNFFDGLAVDFWVKIVPPEQTLKEVELLLSKLKVKPPAKLLDVPCGSGRHAVELAEGGFELTAVDLSDGFLKVACKLSEKVKDRIHLLKADMSEFSQIDAFDGAYCLGNSFGYLDYQRQRQFLKNVAISLKGKGRFVIDASVAAECVLPTFEERDWLDAGGLKMMIKNVYYPGESMFETEYTFVFNGKVETRTSIHRIYTIAEIERLLVEAGFEVMELLADPEGHPFEYGSEQLFVVAQKR